MKATSASAAEIKPAFNGDATDANYGYSFIYGNAATYLSGNGSWATPAGSGDVTTNTEQTITAGKNFTGISTFTAQVTFSNINTSDDSLWRICFSTVIVSSCTSINVTGLLGNTDKEYKIQWAIKNAYAGACSYALTLNADTGANYGYQYVRYYGTSVDTDNPAVDQTSCPYCFGYGSNINYYAFGETTIYARKWANLGLQRLVFSRWTGNATGETIGQSRLSNYVWSNGTDEITSFQIVADQTNGIGEGSYFEVWTRK
jgi:hypothetical protein